MKPNIPFYVSSAWLSFDIRFINDLPNPAKERIKAFGAGTPFLGEKRLQNFKAEFKKRFGAQPQNEIFEGYEAGFFAAHILHGANEASRQSVLASLRRIKCVEILHLHKICRNPDGFSSKKLHYFRWTNQGFTLADE